MSCMQHACCPCHVKSFSAICGFSQKRDRCSYRNRSPKMFKHMRKNCISRFFPQLELPTKMRHLPNSFEERDLVLTLGAGYHLLSFCDPPLGESEDVDGTSSSDVEDVHLQLQEPQTEESPPEHPIDEGVTEDVLDECTSREEDSGPIEIQQPLPFQVSLTPHSEEPEVQDELRDWHDDPEPPLFARGSTNPTPKTKPKS